MRPPCAHASHTSYARFYAARALAFGARRCRLCHKHAPATKAWLALFSESSPAVAAAIGAAHIIIISTCCWLHNSLFYAFFAGFAFTALNSRLNNPGVGARNGPSVRRCPMKPLRLLRQALPYPLALFLFERD